MTKRYKAVDGGKTIGFAEFPPDTTPTTEELRHIKTFLVALQTKRTLKTILPPVQCPLTPATVSQQGILPIPKQIQALAGALDRLIQWQEQRMDNKAEARIRRMINKKGRK